MEELCRRHSTISATCYNWKSKYGGIVASDLKRFKELEEGNTHLWGSGQYEIRVKVRMLLP